MIELLKFLVFVACVFLFFFIAVRCFNVEFGKLVKTVLLAFNTFPVVVLFASLVFLIFGWCLK